MAEPKSPIFSNMWYDRMKFFAQVVLPALASLYLGLAQLWDLPAATQVTGTIMLLNVFLGILLQVSTSRYAKGGGEYDGEIVTQKLPGGEPFYALAFETREKQEAANNKDVVTLKVKPTS